MAAVLEAVARMDEAFARLCSEAPYTGGFLAGATWRASDDIPTMCVGFSGVCVELRFNPTWVNALPSVELVANVQRHEALHLLLGHPWRPRARFPKARLWAIASDTCVNEMIPGPLPDGALASEDFDLPLGSGTEERYDLLEERGEDPLGAEEAADHDWSSFDHPLARAVVDTAKRRAALAVDPFEVECLPGAVWLEVFGGPAPADASDVSVESIDVMPHRAGDWKTILRASVGQRAGRASRKLPALDRPNRRFPHLVGLVAGTRRAHHDAPRVLFAVDTSSSVSKADLGRIAVEVRVLSRLARVEVLMFDTAIRNRATRGGVALLREAHGRGSTDFSVAFSPEALDPPVDLVVVATDGLGPMPAPPAIPVVWLLTSAPPILPRFGRIVLMRA
ncbi:MAG: VWA-like domain-containing protein [Polyangiaceae bacterium]